MEILKKIKNNKAKIGLVSISLVVMLISLGTVYGTPDNLVKTSATSELKSFLNEKMDENKLLIIDSRTYSARSFWLATPNGFLLSSQFPDIYNQIINLPQDKLKPVEVFYVECAIDDCGWGWIQNDQDLNQTSEQLAEIFSQNGILVKTISAPKHTNQEILNSADQEQIYKVYYLTLNLPDGLIEESKKIQSFYFAPYLYKNLDNYIFKYDVSGIDKLIEKLALWVIYLAMILSILAVFGVIFLMIKEN